MKPLLCDAGAGRRGEDDRLSALPDEIIQEIMARLPSTNEAARATVLSRRWTRLWRPYPTLEFHIPSSRSVRPLLQRFIAAAEKQLPGHHVEALRIDVGSYYGVPLSNFVTALLNMIGARPPPTELEIKFEFGHQSVLLPSQLTNLEILKLSGCSFERSCCCLHPMVNLRVLSLTRFAVEDDRLLNDVIAGAPLLEDLNLGSMYSRNKGSEESGRLQICDRTNLKSITVRSCPFTKLIQIKGVNSLQTLTLEDSIHGDLDASPPPPNLRSLLIGRAPSLTDAVLYELISGGCPSLQWLYLYDLPRVDELRILSPNLEHLELACPYPKGMPVHIDAPKLVDAQYSGYVEDALLSIGYAAAAATNNLEPAASLCRAHIRFTPQILRNREFADLKCFLAKTSSRFRLVELCFDCRLGKASFDWNRINDDSPAVAVHCVEFEGGIDGEPDGENEAFLVCLLWSCHPKYLRLTQCCTQEIWSTTFKYLYEFLVRRTVRKCNKAAYKCFYHLCKFVKERRSCECRTGGHRCWRHQLKNVKIVKKSVREEGDDEGEDEYGLKRIDELISIFTETDQIVLRLTWY
ncbi:unnamed protein product [Linum tenue]|uniref:F-box domain-containing protein n=1 Tax=Linum tenue TaxID=586396 RepID=A0AAV0JCB6_9ROSI|nr:unnamed protein product [Linum tenue]